MDLVKLSETDGVSMIVQVDKETAEKLRTDLTFATQFVIKHKQSLAASELCIPQVELGEPEQAAGSEEEEEEATGEPSVKWRRKAIFCLIKLREEMDELFDNPPCRKKKLWERLAAKMQKMGFKCTGFMCDKKWRNLAGTYRFKTSHHKKTGTRITWEFYNAMHAFLGNKPLTDTSKSSLLNSLKNATAPDSSRSPSPPLQTDEAVPTLMEVSILPNPSTNKIPATEELPEWFQRYVEKRDRKRRQDSMEFQIKQHISKKAQNAVKKTPEVAQTTPAEQDPLKAIHQLTSAILQATNPAGADNGPESQKLRPKKRLAEEPPEWFQQYLEKRDNEMAKRREQKRMETERKEQQKEQRDREREEKIEQERVEVAKREQDRLNAIDRLTTAILELANKGN